MRMRRRWMVAIGAVVFGVAVCAGAVLATPQAGVTTSTVAKATVGPLDLKAHSIPANTWGAMINTRGDSDLYVVDNKVAVGGTTGWHSHLGPSLIFVLAGTISNYHGDDPTCTPHTYTAGESFVDEGGSDVHMLRNNGTVQAETLAVQFLPQGAQRKIDVPTAPQPC